MWDKLHKNHKLDEDAMRIVYYSKFFEENLILYNMIMVHQNVEQLITLVSVNEVN